VDNVIRFIGENRALEILGVKLVGFNAENAKKLLFTIIFVCIVLLLSWALHAVTRRAYRQARAERLRFWTRQGIHLFAAVLLILGILSIWFDDPTRLATAMGLVSAGLAFALQKVITSIAGYFVILRGRTFNVGDRITMGGVRGDVIGLGFIQTTIMEMGQPPPVQTDEPAMWVQSRQYTGRIVTVSNDKIFDQPVYNYTRYFPYIWEEISVPISYDADRVEAEKILLDAAARHTITIAEMSEESLREMKRRYFVQRADDMKPKVYYRLTDNWLELTVRFIVEEHGVRIVKDLMSRDILWGLKSAGIGVASATFEIVGLPALRFQNGSPSKPSERFDRVKHETR